MITNILWILREGYLDILFEENLNEIGMYVKIFRCYASKDVVNISPKAACLINKALEKYSYEDINNYEMKSYGESTFYKIYVFLPKET